jgi:hypothetical protein
MQASIADANLISVGFSLVEVWSWLSPFVFRAMLKRVMVEAGTSDFNAASFVGRSPPFSSSSPPSVPLSLIILDVIVPSGTCVLGARFGNNEALEW